MPKAVQSSPLEAVAEMAGFLREKEIPYVVMGGLAVQYWGEPRATRDVDIPVLVPAGGEDVFIEQVLQRFSPRIPDAASFARKHRILLVCASNGCPVDISLGIAGYEEEMMARAVEIPWPVGSPVRLISCEDLIIHKCVAGRPRDAEDVQRIILRRKGQIDEEYVRKWLREFLPLVPHDPLSVFEEELTKSR